MYKEPGISFLNSKRSVTPRHSKPKIRNEATTPRPSKAYNFKISKKRIFLDLSLEDIANLPEEYGNLEIGFTHSNGINKVKRSCAGEPNNLELNKFEYYKPEYRINIEPTNIENLNKISDEPIMITLYEHIKPKPKLVYWPPVSGSEEFPLYLEEGEEEYEDDIEERLIPLAQGHLDFLQLLTNQRVTISMEAFMYSTNYQNNPLKSLKTNWKFRSPTALLGEQVANIIFIAMESIFNAPQTLIEQSENLGVKLSFQPKNQNQMAVHSDRRSITSRKRKSSKSNGLLSNKIEICKFERFQGTVIVNQSVCLKWESLKDVDLDNLLCVGIHTPIRIKTLEPYKGLLGTEYVDFQFDKIIVEDDLIIVGNSLHRYLLTEEYCKIIEKIIACNEQSILVEVYHIDAPNIILYDGIIDLSILAFPSVNARRFAVELRPKLTKKSIARSSKRSTTTERTRISERTLKSENLINEEINVVPAVKKPVFIILSICLQTPISETSSQTNSPDLISVPITENRCTYIPTITIPNNLNICAGLNQQFDTLAVEMTEYIIDRKLQTMSDAQDYFCCQLSEMRNLLSGIIACNYNTKYKTNSNIEFTRLVTTVYNDMEKRLMDLVLKVIKNKENKVTETVESETYMILLSNIVKYSREFKLFGIEHFINEKILSLFGKNFATSLEFFKYFCYVENENFGEAKIFEISFNGKGNLSPYVQFQSILETYTSYRKAIQNYDPKKLLGTLLNNILTYAKFISGRIEGWVLLYCYYARHLYYPGMEFARHKFEDLYESNMSIENPAFPLSRWTMYNSFIPTGIQTLKMQMFLKVMLHYANLGVYEFAAIIYDQVCTELTDPVNYLMKTTLQILLGELPDTFECQTFVVDPESIDAMDLKAALHNVNGHAEFYLGNIPAAMSYYAQIRDIELANFKNYKLGLMRYAFNCIENANYEESYNTLKLFCNNELLNIDAHYTMGRTLYLQNKFDESEKHFAIITRFRIHIPDVWAYLALINLRKELIYNAIIFWKYAKTDPGAIICNEILEELEKIDHKSINLFVDKPKEIRKSCK